MKLEELEDGQTVRARWGRAGEEAPNWGPWQEVRLHVQRHKGRIVLVALKDVAWAEAGPRDLCPPDDGSENAYFVVEDYYLEIDQLCP